jgi:hypothetical protein
MASMTILLWHHGAVRLHSYSSWVSSSRGRGGLLRFNRRARLDHRAQIPLVSAARRLPLSKRGRMRKDGGTLLGLEGIVSKRKDSRYRSGRSPDWIKSKNPACAAVTREAEEDWGR